MVNYKLNERVKELRTARNLTQVQLADVLGISKQSVSNWENDNICPSIETVWLIADYFGVSTDYLIGRGDKRYLDIDGLSEKQIGLIQMLIDEMR